MGTLIKSTMFIDDFIDYDLIAEYIEDEEPIEFDIEELKEEVQDND